MTVLQQLPLDDPDVLAAAAPLDDDGFSAALAQAWPRLLRLAARRLRDRHEAEEVVQETLLRAFEHREQLRTADDVLAWTHVVLGRLVIDRVRVRVRSVCVAEVPDEGRLGPDTADVVTAREEARLALDALAALPARQAAVLWAREIEGLGYDAIGARHGLTEPAVRSVLLRARRSLRREFTLRGGVAPVAGVTGLAVLAAWLGPLRSAARLRHAATATAVAGALALAGLALLPLRVPASPVPSAPQVSVTSMVHMPAAAGPAGEAAPAAVAAPAAALSAVRAKSPPPSAPRAAGAAGAAGAEASAAHPAASAGPSSVVSPRAGVPRLAVLAAPRPGPVALGPSACAGGRGLNCAAPQGERVRVLPTGLAPLPGVTGIDGLAVTVAGASCPQLPAGSAPTPLTICEAAPPSAAPSRTASPPPAAVSSSPISSSQRQPSYLSTPGVQP